MFISFCKWYSLADPRGGARDARPPWGSKFFHFHAVFGKNVKNNSNFGSWRPPGENPGSATGTCTITDRDIKFDITICSLTTLYFVFFSLCSCTHRNWQAEVVEYIANNIKPKFSVVTNWPSDNSDLQLFEVDLPMKFLVCLSSCISVLGNYAMVRLQELTRVQSAEQVFLNNIKCITKHA